MKYTIHPSKTFLVQVQLLTEQTQRKLAKRISLLAKHPFRNKRLTGYDLLLFRIRITDQKRKLRVIYLVDNTQIRLLFILDRKDDYKDLRKELEKLELL